MNWEAIATFSEVIGAAGIIVTLVYLAIQIRSNTTSTIASSRWAIANGYREILNLSLDPENADAFREGLWEYRSMPYERQIKFGILMANETQFFQAVFAQYEAGQLDAATNDAYLQWFSGLVATPGGGQWWEDTRRVFVSTMVAEIDRRVKEGGLPDPRKTKTWGRKDGDA